MNNNLNLGSFIYGEAIPIDTTVYLDRNSVLLLGVVLFVALFGALYISKKL